MESKANSINPTSLKNWQAYCIEKQRSIDYLPFQGDDLSEYKTWLESRYKTAITVSKHFNAIQAIAILPVKTIQAIALLPASKVIEIFIQKYPKVFISKNPLPLAIGIHKVLIAELPEVHPRAINSALKHWCKRREYKEKVFNGEYRYNLDGSVWGANAQYKTTYPIVKPKIIEKPKQTQELVKKVAGIIDMGTVAVKNIKITIPVKVGDLPPLPRQQPGEAIPEIKLALDSGGATVTTTVKGKSYRKALETALQQGPETMVIIQGRLGLNGILLDAGIVVPPSKPKTVA